MGSKKDSTHFRRRELYWGLNQGWTKAFFISHISGWIIATLQTLWIVYEVRKLAKNMGAVKRNDMYNDRRNQS